MKGFCVIASYADTATKRFFEDRKPHKKLPKELHGRTWILLDIMDIVDSLELLKVRGSPPSLRLHGLTGNLKGSYAIDIHKIMGWRITFIWKDNCFHNVSIENYH